MPTYYLMQLCDLLIFPMPNTFLFVLARLFAPEPENVLHSVLFFMFVKAMC